MLDKQWLGIKNYMGTWGNRIGLLCDGDRLEWQDKNG
jgi:hypothetical protein